MIIFLIIIFIFSCDVKNENMHNKIMYINKQHSFVYFNKGKSNNTIRYINRDIFYQKILNFDWVKITHYNQHVSIDGTYTCCYYKFRLDSPYLASINFTTFNKEDLKIFFEKGYKTYIQNYLRAKLGYIPRRVHYLNAKFYQKNFKNFTKFSDKLYKFIYEILDSKNKIKLDESESWIKYFTYLEPIHILNIKVSYLIKQNLELFKLFLQKFYNNLDNENFLNQKNHPLISKYNKSYINLMFDNFLKLIKMGILKIPSKIGLVFDILKDQDIQNFHKFHDYLFVEPKRYPKESIHASNILKLYLRPIIFEERSLKKLYSKPIVNPFNMYYSKLLTENEINQLLIHYDKLNSNLPNHLTVGFVRKIYGKLTDGNYAILKIIDSYSNNYVNIFEFELDKISTKWSLIFGYEEHKISKYFKISSLNPVCFFKFCNYIDSTVEDKIKKETLIKNWIYKQIIKDFIPYFESSLNSVPTYNFLKINLNKINLNLLVALFRSCISKWELFSEDPFKFVDLLVKFLSIKRLKYIFEYLVSNTKKDGYYYKIILYFIKKLNERNDIRISIPYQLLLSLNFFSKSKLEYLTGFIEPDNLH